MGYTTIAQSSSYQSSSQMSSKACLFSCPEFVSQSKAQPQNARLNKLEAIVYSALKMLMDYIPGTNYFVRAQEALERIVDTRPCCQSVIQSNVSELNSLISSEGCRVQFCDSSQRDDESYEVQLRFYEGEEENFDDRIILRKNVAGRALPPEEFPEDNCTFSHIEPLTHTYSISKPDLVSGLRFEMPQFISQSDEAEFVSQPDEVERFTKIFLAGSIPKVEKEIFNVQLVSQPANTESVTPNYWADSTSEVGEDISDKPLISQPANTESVTLNYGADPTLEVEEDISDDQVVSQSANTESVTLNFGADPTLEVEEDISDGQLVSQLANTKSVTPNYRADTTSEVVEDISDELLISQLADTESVTPNYWVEMTSEVEEGKADDHPPPLKRNKDFEKWEKALNNRDKKPRIFGCSFNDIERMPLNVLRKSDKAKSMLFVSSSNNNTFRLNYSMLEILVSEEHRNSAICLKDNITSVLNKLGIEVHGFSAKIMDEVPTECNWNAACINISNDNQSDLNLFFQSIYTLRQIGFHALANSLADAINSHRLENGLMPFSCLSRVAESPLCYKQRHDNFQPYEIDEENENAYQFT